EEDRRRHHRGSAAGLKWTRRRLYINGWHQASRGRECERFPGGIPATSFSGLFRCARKIWKKNPNLESIWKNPGGAFRILQSAIHRMKIARDNGGGEMRSAEFGVWNGETVSWQLSVVGDGVHRTRCGVTSHWSRMKEPPGGTPGACATNPK